MDLKTLMTTGDGPMNFENPFRQTWGIKPFLPDHPSALLPSSSPLTCANCCQPNATKRCASCKDIHYCNASCQTVDWAIHKLVCKAFANESDRPGANFHRVLVFNATSPRVSVNWVPALPDGSDDLASLFPNDDNLSLSSMLAEDERLSYPFEIHFLTPSQATQFPLNRALTNLLGAQNVNVFRGPFVVVATDKNAISTHINVLSPTPSGAGQALKLKPAADVHADVLKPVKEYLTMRTQYKGPIFSEQPQKWYAAEEWREFMKDMVDIMEGPDQA